MASSIFRRDSRPSSKRGANWLHYASRATGGSPKAKLDAYGLLKTIVDNWRDVFDDAFGRSDKHKARNFTSMALEARNAISHLAIGLQDDEALRYLDAMHQLLKLVKAPAGEIAELKKLYDAQRQSGMISAPPAVAQPTLAPKLELAIGDAPLKPLKSWIEVVLPHPDVLANQFKEAEFAADLFAVDAGHATEDYASSENFFRITFLTEGLKRVLTSSLQRLANTGGDPVIGLQTAFGGGKTHTMLAVYHLAKVADLKHLEGTLPPRRPSRGESLEAPADRGIRRLFERHRCFAEPEGWSPSPYPVGLYRVAARRRGRPKTGGAIRSRADQSRLRADGRGAEARRTKHYSSR